MLSNLHGHDLARIVHRDFHLHRLEALRVIHLRAGLGSRSLHSSGSVRGSGLERAVDGVARQGHAGLHIDLRGGDVLADQRVEHGGVGNQVSAEARRLVVLGDLHGHDLARVVHRDFNLHRLEALRVIHLRVGLGSGSLALRFGSCRSGISGSGGSGIHRLAHRQRDAIGLRRLTERLVDGVARQRHAALDIHLRRRQILTDQRCKHVVRQHVRAETGRLVVRRDRDRADLAVSNLDVHGELGKALHGVRISRNRRGSITAEGSGSLCQRVVDGVARQGHAALHVDLSGGDVLTDQRVEHGGVGN